jgi:CheY-like chemotaxis protein
MVSIDNPDLGKKILLVDDELFNINALKIILRCFTAIDPEKDCDVAYNGQECINMI